jgi:hypothetical protein
MRAVVVKDSFDATVVTTTGMPTIVRETCGISFCPTVVVVADIEFACAPDGRIVINVEVDVVVVEVDVVGVEVDVVVVEVDVVVVEVDVVVVEVDVVVVEVDVVVVRPTPDDSPTTFVGKALNRVFRSEKPAPIALP